MSVPDLSGGVLNETGDDKSAPNMDSCLILIPTRPFKKNKIVTQRRRPQQMSLHLKQDNIGGALIWTVFTKIFSLNLCIASHSNSSFVLKYNKTVKINGNDST